MIKHLVTSDKLEGHLVFGYNDSDMLVFFENNAEMKDEQVRWLLERINYTLTSASLQQWARQNKWRTVEMTEDLSFARFWDDYDVKRNKIEAERLWNKMSETEKQMVFSNLKAYSRYCKRNIAWYNKMYPDTYLRGHWKDEWDKL